jgi:BioD-like phosphotransacetylase family protein
MSMEHPGVFIAATGQNVGKTTTSLALIGRLHSKYRQVGFMKPVGQRTIERNGVEADEDVLLMMDVFHMPGEVKSMSPVTVPKGFTKEYLDGNTSNASLREAIVKGWERLSVDGAPVVVEGTGHAGVGSVIDINNAQVASLLNLPVVLVAQGGIGRPIDEIALNLALFEAHGAKVKGVIFNKAMSDKIPQMEEYCAKYLKKKGISMLGVVEYSPVLARPSLQRLVYDVKAEVLSSGDNLNAVPTKIITGAAALDYLLDRSVKNCLIVTPASRSDVIMAAAHMYDLKKQGHDIAQDYCGLFLTGEKAPHPDVLKSAIYSGIPILYKSTDTHETVEAIDQSLGKTLPADKEKFEIIDRIYGNAVDWQTFFDIIEHRA